MKPFIKWVGGKSKLVLELEKRFPPSYNQYYEPFIGGGALYFHITPNNAVINDLNSKLINCYNAIRNDVNNLMIELDRLESEFNALLNQEDKSTYYYNIRSEYNERLSNSLSTLDAAYFIFLNKCGFNGLFRENSKGLFNVPFGQKKKLNLYDKENLIAVQKQLKKCIITNQDFKMVCNDAKSGDFVFFDSPYYDTFVGYQKNGFDESQHIALHQLFVDLTNKGVYCMLTNSNTEYIKTLYKDYTIEVVDVLHQVNRNGNDRQAEEVIIRNY